MNELALIILGMLAGKAISERGVLPSDAEVIDALRSVKPSLSKTITIDVSIVRDNAVIDEVGYSMYVENPENSDVAVYVRLNEKDSEAIDITKNRRILAPFYRFFVTNASGTGTLTVVISKNPVFGLEQAQTNIHVTASSIMLPVDIQAQYIDLDTNIKKWGGTTLTGANITTYLAKLDVALSTLATQTTLAGVLTKLDIALSTRASQTTLASVLASLVTHKYTTPANAGVNVTTSSAIILAANSDRLYAAFVNDSDVTIYLGIGAAAVLSTGIRLNAGGGSYEITWANLYTGAIYGIHGGTGNKVLTRVEGD